MPRREPDIVRLVLWAIKYGYCSSLQAKNEVRDGTGKRKRIIMEVIDNISRLLVSISSKPSDKGLD